MLCCSELKPYASELGSTALNSFPLQSNTETAYEFVNSETQTGFFLGPFL